MKNLIFLKISIGGKFVLEYFLKYPFSTYTKIFQKYRKFPTFEKLKFRSSFSFQKIALSSF